MDAPEPFDNLMVRLRAGDEDAAALVFGRFVHRLIALASRQFETRLRHKVDLEEVVQSAYESFFLRYEKGQYELASWDGLWGLLAIITLRKCSSRREYLKAARRDPARELNGRAHTSGLCWEAVDRGPSPDHAAVLTETVERLLNRFDPPERAIVELSLQGYTTPEIADRLGRSRRTVRRVRERVKLQLIAEGAEQ
jgi:RNA polymerase sigma-70 factor (ECF subfamily)